MLRQRAGRISEALDGIFALVIVVSCILGHVTKLNAGDLLSHRVSLLDAAASVCFCVLWRYCFIVLGVHSRQTSFAQQLRDALKGVALMTTLLAGYLAIFHPSALKVHDLVRTAFALAVYECVRLAFAKYLLGWLMTRDPPKAVIVGSGRRASKAWRELRVHHHGSVNLLGFVDDRPLEDMAPDVAKRYLGSAEDLEMYLRDNAVDLILIALPVRSCYELGQRVIHLAESAGIRVVYLGDIYSRHKAEGEDGIFRELDPLPEHYFVQMACKRCVDIVGSALALLMLFPLLLLIATCVKVSSAGPIFFVQERYGYHRRRFRMMKFRSMVDGAEAMLPSLEHANEATGPIFKISSDPRITAFGRFIRSTSIDELPQFWNVLCGHMSLVGPRPMSVRDVSLFSNASLMRRFSVKPGLTGLWQVSGRSHVSFDQWIALDNNYIDQWSLRLDFKILARTCSTVWKRSGAM